MSNTYTGLASGTLNVQKYNEFRGVDFTDDEVNLKRSPDSLNMWKNYKTLGKNIETRPGIETLLNLDNDIFGLFFYKINDVEYQIIHSGVSVYLYNPQTEEKITLKATGMNTRKSEAFIFNNIFYLIDGLHYYQYDGVTFKEVEGYIPTTSIGRKPSGGGSAFEGVNLLSTHRINTFWGDNKTKQYVLDSREIDSVYKVWILNKDTGVWVEQSRSSYSVDIVNGKITFNTAPYEPQSSDNVKIEYVKSVQGYRNRINHSTKVIVFDNNVFFAGNEDYPNNIFFSALNKANYIPDQNYLTDGTEDSEIKGMAVGNGALWVFKEPSQDNTTIFYHQPMETEQEIGDNEYVTKVGYPTIYSTISTGCIATGINFNDDIVFFSNRGMEGIQNSLNSEQVLGHRSSFIDRKLLNEENYSNMTLTEWNGYLLVIIDDTIYLADSRQKTNVTGHYEYEWYYWKLDKKIVSATTHKDILYLCSKSEQIIDENGYKKYTDGETIYWYNEENQKLYTKENNEYTLVENVVVENLTQVKESGIYTLTDESPTRNIISYWSTPKDDYGYPQMLKTTNKRGFKTDLVGSSINIDVCVDNGLYESLGTFNNTKGYVICKLKRKKWNKIQLKFSSNVPFGIYQVTLESYIGSYVKRS